MISFENKGYIIKVLYFGNRISVEAFHSITDGSGISEFMKSLVYYYICIKHGKIDSQNKILLFDETDKNDEDSFSEKFSNIPKQKNIYKIKNNNSFIIRGERFERKGHRVITGIVSVDSLKKCCKDYNCTITSLLTANIIMSIYNQKQKNTRNKKPITVCVPVNLRKIFNSKTLKNFFGVVHIEYKVNENTTFEEIVKSVSDQLKSLTDKDNLTFLSAQNVKMSNNVFSKHTPLIIKNIVMPVGFNFMSENKKTITISNIGRIDFPDSMKPYIEHSELILYPTNNSPINCGVCSFEDKLTINFTSSITDTSIIKDFLTSLSLKIKSDITVYSNEWGESYEQMS